MNRIVITMDGGLIQHINADRLEDIQVIIVDFDCEGTADNPVRVPLSDGAEEEALVSVYPVGEGRPWLDTVQGRAAATHEGLSHE